MSSIPRGSLPYEPTGEKVITRLGSFLALALAGIIDQRRREVVTAIHSHRRVGPVLWDEDGDWPADCWALGRQLLQILEEGFLAVPGVREGHPGIYRLPARFALPGVKTTKVFFKTEPDLRGQHARTPKEAILAFHVHEFWPEMRRCADAVPKVSSLPGVAERIFYRLELFAQDHVGAPGEAEAGAEGGAFSTLGSGAEFAARCRGLAARLHFSGAGQAAGPLGAAAAGAFLTPDDRVVGITRSCTQTLFSEACRQVSSALLSLERHARRPADAGPSIRVRTTCRPRPKRHANLAKKS